MDYQKAYDRLVQKNHVFSEREYFETHHKVPKCLGGTDDANNLVNLTAREHYIAHLLLVKITKLNNDAQAYGKMLYAFNCMKWGRCKGERSFKFNSRLYQKVKCEYASLRKQMMKTSHNPSFGMMWIHSDDLKVSKRWNKDLPIPIGWISGRVLNWESHFNAQKEKEHKLQARKEREHKLEQRMTRAKQEYTEMYKVYCESGFDVVKEKFGYKFSQVNFVNQCKRYVDEYVPQNGKKRGK